MEIKKVMVIGGAGYVGSALVPTLLKKGYEVTVYDLYWYGNVFLDINNPKLKQIKGDIRDKEKLVEAAKGQDTIIHLACISNDPSFDLNPELGKSINLDAFPNVLEAAKSNNVKRFIYASSSSVYGIKDELNVTEESTPEPLTDYSKYKLECEKILKENAGDLNYVIVRPATVCGYSPRVRLDVVVNILTINGLVNKKIKILGGKQLRPNLNIKDMVLAYLLLLSAPLEKINRQIFNIGYENHQVGEIGRIVQKVINDASLEYVETNDNRSYHVNSDKIKKVIGFQPQHSVEEAVKTIAEAYNQGLIVNGLENPIYHNIKRMQELNGSYKLINKEFILSLLRKIMLIRRAEEKVAKYYPEHEMRCPIHLSVGQEAVAAGVCQNLTDKDVVFSNHRSHAHYMAKGGDIKKMFAEFYGKETGCSKGMGGSMCLNDHNVNFLGSTSIVGSMIPVAVGSAFSSKLQKKNNITVSFFGDAGVEEGVFHESANFASLKKLPILFACENNLYSVYTRITDRQPQRDLIEVAKAHNIHAEQINGNNVLEVYEKTKKAIELIKQGKGPVFLEFLTYRLMTHCGTYYDDDDLNYRPKQEIEQWKKKDPLEHIKKVARENNISDEEIEKMESEIDKELEEAIKFAKQSSFPKKELLNEYLFSK